MKAKKSKTKRAPLSSAGRQGALTEQMVLRISKATSKRIRSYQREHQYETRADAVRAALREVGL